MIYKCWKKNKMKFAYEQSIKKTCTKIRLFKVCLEYFHEKRSMPRSADFRNKISARKNVSDSQNVIPVHSNEAKGITIAWKYIIIICTVCNKIKYKQLLTLNVSVYNTIALTVGNSRHFSLKVLLFTYLAQPHRVVIVFSSTLLAKNSSTKPLEK